MKKKITISINEEIIIIKIYHPILRRNSNLRAIKHNNECIEICDIQAAINNIGDGTALVNKLIDYAKINNFKTITGWISDADKDHLERLNYFYKKLGFKISKANDPQNPMKLYDLLLNINHSI